jgi:flavin-binding protein dodecin
LATVFIANGRERMSTKKVIEILAESSDSWEAAAQKAVDDASKTLRGITSVYIKEFEAKVENNRVTSFRINAKVTFGIEESLTLTSGGTAAGNNRTGPRAGPCPSCAPSSLPPEDDTGCRARRQATATQPAALHGVALAMLGVGVRHPDGPRGRTRTE